MLVDQDRVLDFVRDRVHVVEDRENPEVLAPPGDTARRQGAEVHLAGGDAGPGVLAAGQRDHIEPGAGVTAECQHAKGGGMGEPADADIHRPLLTFGDDFVDVFELALAANEDDPRVPVHLAEIEHVIEIEGRLLHHPVQHLGPHIAKQQLIAIGLGDAHVFFVADPARGAGIERRLEVDP